jgi:hypothetical protein
MLFASTRNTLTRELGAQKFADSIFATTKAELTAEGFRKHDDHAAEYEFHGLDALMEDADELKAGTLNRGRVHDEGCTGSRSRSFPGNVS